MKNRLFHYLILFLLLHAQAIGCELCEAQQPKILRGITHGSGPQGNSDYVIVIVAALFVIITAVYAVKLLARPGERGPDHIKRRILQKEHHGI